MKTRKTSHIDLDHFWPYQTVVLADQISRYTLEVVKTQAGLNQSQWRVLAAVADKPGRTAAEVTAVTPMDKTIVSRAVNSLIDSGLIQKIPNPVDKRRSSLKMTKLGDQKYKIIATILNETLSVPLTDGTTTDKFVEILKQFGQQISEISQQ